MKARRVSDRVSMVAAVDWDRRLFDSLIPLPDGTSYNSYIVRGDSKTALIDAVDPKFERMILDEAGAAGHVAFIVANHAEQDHSGSLPALLARLPEAVVLCTPKCRDFLVDLVHIPPDRARPVADGEKVSLGGRTLEFIHMPWVHWPETMVTRVPEEGLLFSCDLFGSHLATNELYASDEAAVYEPAKRYYAEIMMPFRGLIQRHLERLSGLGIKAILPSHGPAYPRPAFIMDAYRDWASDAVRNTVVLPYVSMHGSTAAMADRLVQALTDEGIRVERFELSSADPGKLAVALVDAATLIVGTPAVLGGPHPHAAGAAYLAGLLRPKLRFASLFGSFGWGHHVVETLQVLMKGLKAEFLPPVLARGAPRAGDLGRLDALAAEVAARHRAAGILGAPAG